ncbi:hypothetical protein B6S44_03200 [Bosea sp. Tri-44]|uniref:VWA domain-containing protein n=1 Tax=Bosea sp. Tri-44 TaxID=1972137 RepID=UPI0010287843|nr:VWA domain-containing protein [Bosea sp. Tri-44]RXT57439.1 hypothetical protein B6S44_03200 [Bosea sp. Tri-44]
MIETLSAFHFERPLWLLALLPAVALWLAERRHADPVLQWQRVIDAQLLPHLLVGTGRQARIGPVDGLLLAWLLATIAVAGPAWQREPSPFAAAKPAVAVVLKLSPSMLTEDLAPTRLDRARQKLADILAAREGAATALVAYSGSAHLVLPPTPDSSVVLDLAKALSPRIMPKEGDDLAGALALANRALASSADGGSILLMADTISPEAVAGLAGVKSAPVTLLALVPPGTDTGGLDDGARAIAAAVVPTTADQNDVAAAVRRLDAGGRAAHATGEGERWREAGYWLTPVLALLALLWFRRGWVLS